MINQLVSQREQITLTRNYLFPSQLAAHYIIGGVTGGMDQTSGGCSLC